MNGTEREVKLAVPVGFRLLDLGGVADDVVAVAGDVRRLTTTYWDTADLRLVRRGSTLRHRAGEGWTVKLPGGQAGAVLVRRELRFPGTQAEPPAEAADLVAALARTETLQPVVRMRTVRRVTVLRHADGRRFAEIDDDEVSVLDGRRVAARFRELELELDEEIPRVLLEGILERLRAAGAGDADPTPKLVRALGSRAQQPPDGAAPDLNGDVSAAVVIRRAIAASVDRLIVHDPGVRLGGDVEDVHQARVATRRLRSDLRTFGPLLDEEWTAPLREELRWIGGELGAVRDLDVLRERIAAAVAHLDDEDDAARGAEIVGRLDTALVTARGRLLSALRTRRYLELLNALVAAASAPHTTARARGPAAEVLPALAVRPWRALRRARRRLGEPASDGDLHALRILAKRCRYAAEAVGPVAGRRVARFARSVAALQTVLGDHHDAVVAEGWLRDNASRGRTAFAAGMLVGIERAARDDAASRWRAAWKAIDAPQESPWT